MNIFLVIIELVVGALLLGFAGDRFISASSALARHLNIPALVAGVLIVGFGTSFPELIVSSIAAFHGKTQIAVGNVLGSNIANIALVLSVATLIATIQVNSRLIKREFPVLIIVSLVVGAILWNGHLSRWDGVILLLLLVLHIYWTMITLPKREDPMVAELAAVQSHIIMSRNKAILWWLLGLLLLFVSSELLVNGAVSVAKLMGVSDLVIGLSIVTIGTSLPEFAATIVSALKKEHDIAIGHIVGSNIFNSLAVLAMPAIIAPSHLPSTIRHRDFPVMLSLTIALWLFTFVLPKKRGRLGRWFGIVFLAIYLVYLLWLFVA